MNIPKAWVFTVPAGLIAVIGAIADRGEKIVGVFNLLSAWTAQLPMGLWSFGASLVLSGLVWATAIKKLPPRDCGKRAHFSADTLALLAALFVTVGQQWTVHLGSGAMLQAITSGLVAGLAAPFIVKGFMAAMKQEKPSAVPDDPT